MNAEYIAQLLDLDGIEGLDHVFGGLDEIEIYDEIDARVPERSAEQKSEWASVILKALYAYYEKDF